MSSRSLLKAPFIRIEGEQVRFIDSDALFEERIGQLPQPTEEADDSVTKYGFDPYGDGEPSMEEDPSVSALFGENDQRAGVIMDESMEGAPVGGADADGFSAGLDAEQVDEATMGVGVISKELEQARAEAQEIIEQAQQQAEAIISQAQMEAESQAAEIHQTARIQGQEEGYQEGMAKAAAQEEAMKRNYAEKERILEAEYDEKLRTIEPDLVEELTGIYEHIFSVDLSNQRSLIRHLITNTMHALDSSQTYLIHVSPQDYSALSMQKNELRAECNIADGATMEFVEDISLTKNQCLIETDDGIFDCSLTVQLDELKRKLMLLSYEGLQR